MSGLGLDLRWAVIAGILGISAGASAQPVALLPSVGETSEGDRKSLDTALRQAFRGEDGVQLQGAPDTKRHLLSLAEMGLVCVPEDVPCLCKLGIAADVALVVVPVVEGSAKSLSVTIGVVDVASAAQLRTVKASVALGEDKKIKALVGEALGRKAPEVPPDPPPDTPPDVPPDTPPDVPLDEPVAAPGNPATTAGFVIAGIGGAVAVVGVIGAVASELAFRGDIGGFDSKTRGDVIKPAGIGLWITGAVGLVGLASGLVVALVTQSESE